MEEIPCITAAKATGEFVGAVASSTMQAPNEPRVPIAPTSWSDLSDLPSMVLLIKKIPGLACRPPIPQIYAHEFLASVR
jgi:hypothetical protein